MSDHWGVYLIQKYLGNWKNKSNIACVLFKKQQHVALSRFNRRWISPSENRAKADISRGTIRFTTDEILYHTKRSYFLVPFLHGVVHVVFSSKRRKMPRRFLCRSRCRALSFLFASGRSVKRERVPWIRAECCGKREQPCFISRLQTSSLPGGRQGSGEMREQAGRDYRGFLKALGAAAAAMEVATTLLDGYTPDILPDNGRSGSHWSVRLLA